MTEVQPKPLEYAKARLFVERGIGIANYAIGLALTVGGLALAIRWRTRFGGYGPLRAYYLYTGWAFGVLELLAGAAMMRRWPVRWILELLPLVVPVLAYQYFVFHFILRRRG